MIVKKLKRSAFTLVELMVSLALVIFIMSILSAAFAAASKSFRDLRAAGDLAEKLRGVVTLLRQELSAYHFEGSKKLSDKNFWGSGDPLERANYGPPTQGFFRIEQARRLRLIADVPPHAPADLEEFGTANPEFLNRVTSLHFTVRQGLANSNEVYTGELNTIPLSAPGVTIADVARRFQRASDFNTTPGGISTVRSEWVEVAYWLTPALSEFGAPVVTDPEAANPQPLYSLRRRQRLLWPYDDQGVALPAAARPEISTRPDVTGVPPPPVQMNSPRAVTAPPNRFARTNFVNNPTAPSPFDVTYSGRPNFPDNVADDVILNDVLSFDVQVLFDPANGLGPTWLHLSDPTLQGRYRHSNLSFPTATGPFVFDTWTRENSANGYGYAAIDGDTTTNPAAQPRWEFPNTHASIPLFWPARYSSNPGSPLTIQAIKITLRIYDQKTNSTRQVSLIQDM
jgi:type II secretory pathway pseudopilin PulG